MMVLSLLPVERVWLFQERDETLAEWPPRFRIGRSFSASQIWVLLLEKPTAMCLQSPAQLTLVTYDSSSVASSCWMSPPDAFHK